jgi:two-component system sensor kinase FixL
LKEFSGRIEKMIEGFRDDLERLVRQEKLAVLRQLADGLGHELRNQLGNIKNGAYFLNTAFEEPEPEVKEALKIVDKGLATSERIIDSLLVFARPKHPVRRKVNINDTLRKAISRATMHENIEVVSQLDEAAPLILADHDQLTQVFENIILNAIQAMSPLSSPHGWGGKKGWQLVVKTSASHRPEARLEGSVEPSEASNPEWITVSFTDTGDGIPEENMGKIFEPFFTTRAKGIGLGLALTETLVEGHGGAIEVESELGKGSTFTVKLPIDGEEEA